MLFTAVWPKDESNVLARLGMVAMEEKINDERLQPGIEEGGERIAVITKAKIP